MSGLVVDLFGGPGGWSEAARELGIVEVGIEHDASACATRAEAGHLTIRQDVTTLDTARFRPLEGLIASPPCPTFSSAGGRAGIAELRYLIEHVHACVTGWKPYVPPLTLERADGLGDLGVERERIGIVGVGFSDGLGRHPDESELGVGEGESCHAGDADMPAPDVKPDPRSALVLEPLRFALECVPTWIALEQVPDVLPAWEAYQHVLRAHGWSVWCGILNAADYGVPQTRRRAILMAHRREDVTPPAPTHCEGGASTLLGELAPWVSMAEALGWTDGFFAERQAHGACRHISEPAMTITGSADNGNFAWILDRRQNGAPTLDTSAVPAPTLTSAAIGKGVWTLTRPATTVQGDPRLAPPGHRDREGGEPQFGEDALRLTVEDALRLQSFDATYPVSGTKTKKFEQIGNAIPPLLARAVLSVLASDHRTQGVKP